MACRLDLRSSGVRKTTLAASYLEARSLPCLWYRIDAGDEDIATFFYYLGLAARRVLTGNKKPLPLFTPEYSLGAAVFTRRFFEELFGRGIRIPKRPHVPSATATCAAPDRKSARRGEFTLVFDDYQEIVSASAFHEILANGMEVVPAGVHVIVLSRSSPPPPLARLRAGGAISSVGWDQIRFTAEESAVLIGKIAASKRQKKPAQKSIARLHEKAGGWAAGIILLLETAGGHDFPVLPDSTPEEIFHYFAAEIFKKTDEKTGELLLKTALLPDVTLSSAERLTGTKAAAEILSHLSRNHFFTERTSDAEVLYRYHPLFREFLLTRAGDSLTREETIRLERTAAEILIETGKPEHAAGPLRDAQDWDAFVKLVLAGAPLLLAQGRNRTLQEWIRSIPVEVAAGSPWLQYWLGACRMVFDPVESRRLFEEAFPAFEALEDACGMFLSWAGIAVSLSFSFEDILKLERWFSRLDDLTQKQAAPLPDEALLQVASAVFFAAINLPHHYEIDPWIERTLILTRRSRDIRTVTQILSNMAMYLIVREGDLVKAETAISMLRDLAQSSAAPLVRISSKLAESVFYEFTASHEECLKAVQDGLEISGSTGMRIMDFLLLGQGTLSALNTGDFDAASTLLKKMASTPESAGKYQMVFYHNLIATSALQRGKMEQAVVNMDLAVKLVGEIGQPTSCALGHLHEAQILHEIGRRREALQALSKATRIADSIGSAYIKSACMLTKSYFLLCRGDESQGIELLRKALHTGRTRGHYLTFLWRPSAMTSLCMRALEEGIETEYVQTLIRKRNLVPETHVDIEAWPYPLRIYTLGRFAILIDGEPLTFTGKVQHKPLDLLKSLIAFGGADVAEARLTDALWADAEGDLAHTSFATTLHRLRRLIGREGPIGFVEGKLSLDRRYCWVDAWAFEWIARREFPPQMQS